MGKLSRIVNKSSFKYLNSSTGLGSIGAYVIEGANITLSLIYCMKWRRQYVESDVKHPFLSLN